MLDYLLTYLVRGVKKKWQVYET